MKQLTKDEFMAALVERPVVSEETRKAFAAMEVGEGIEVMRDEWRNKSTPSDYAACYGRNHKRKFQTRMLANMEGWVILRIK